MYDGFLELIINILFSVTHPYVNPLEKTTNPAHSL